jgi:hypothetical protein
MSLLKSFIFTFFWLSSLSLFAQNKQQIKIGLLGDKISSSYNRSINDLQSEIRAIVGERAYSTRKITVDTNLMTSY